jgi:hypothetical protein
MPDTMDCAVDDQAASGAIPSPRLLGLLAFRATYQELQIE